MSSSRFDTHRPVVVLTFVTTLFIVNIEAQDTMPNVISNCYVQGDSYDSNIRCTGDFNVSNFLFEEFNSWIIDEEFKPSVEECKKNVFRGLEIFNSSVEVLDEKILKFHGFKFVTILIENAPNLRHIQPEIFAELKNYLTDFRAINTSLPQYNNFGNETHKSENLFNDFMLLREVYIGEQSNCPSDETLLFPCKCKFGELPRNVPMGLYGWSNGIWSSFSGPFGSSGLQPVGVVFGTTTHITCENENLTGDELKEIFMKVSKSDHKPKHFDAITIKGTKNLTKIPSDVFSNVSITTVLINDVKNLQSIHSNAFGNHHVATSIQVLDINVANFTAASSTEVDDLFRAFSSLTNIRFLRLSKCGIPYIPAFAFTPRNPQKQLNNLRYLSFSLDRKVHASGIKSVGSYAFSGAPNLIKLWLVINYIEEFSSFSFAFNQTSNRPLTIHIGGNPFNDTYGLKPNAFSGAQRPLQIKFEINDYDMLRSDVKGNSFGPSPLSTSYVNAIKPSLHFIPEAVFRPFIEENIKNYFEVDYFNVDIWCDCESQWMFDHNGKLKQSVQSGLRIKRELDSEPLSIQCKVESSFECLPNCLTFPGMIHCGGNKQFDVTSTFHQVDALNETKMFEKILFSSKEIRELPMDAFGNFQFQHIELAECWNLSSIHPDAFRASTEAVKTLSVQNTNLTHYPNFATFPNLERIQLDKFKTYNINSSNFDFTQANRNPINIKISMSNGTIDPDTFTKLNNETALILTFGERERKVCSTLECELEFKVNKFTLEERTIKTFFEANPKNQIATNFYLECSCDLQWMYEAWKTNIGSQLKIAVKEIMKKGNEFYCVPQGANLKIVGNIYEGFDGVGFKYGSTYFTENCSH